MPTQFTQKQIVIIGAVAFIAVVLGVLIFLNLRPSKNGGPAANLVVWGTEDGSSLQPLFAAFPYGKVKYLQVDPSNYQSLLLSALAAGTGPDVFEIGNRDLPKWQSTLTPLPAAFLQSFGPTQLTQYFPDVVARDFVASSSLYGLPLSIDTMVMIYNRDLINSAGIATMPATWDDFDADVAKLRKLNAQNQITQAGAAIGGSAASVPNAADILSLLMLQNGTPMTSQNGLAATFADQSNGAPGLAAFNFYLQFANAASPYYTWNEGMGNAMDAFAQGKAAIIFGYQSDLAAIKAKAPFLNVGTAAMPQPAGAAFSVNYPKYTGFVVSKASQQTTAAWNLVFYLTTTGGNPAAYAAATGRPPALRSGIRAAENDPNLSVFAVQELTAKSWHEADDAQIRNVLSTAITQVLAGAEDPSRALNEAEVSVTQLMSHTQSQLSQ